MSSLIRTDPSGICITSAGRPTAAAAAPRPPGRLDLTPDMKPSTKGS